MSARQDAIRGLFENAVQIKRTAKMEQLETTIEREAARRGRYTRSIGRRIRHGSMSPEELQAWQDEKRALALELETRR